MAAPHLRIAFEPNKGGKALFLPLAPSKAGEREFAKIALRLTITNLLPRAVELEGITFSFPGSDAAPRKMGGIAASLAARTKMTGVGDPTGNTLVWSNGIVRVSPLSKDTLLEDVDNRIFLAAPVPSQVKVAVHCVGFDTPHSETWDLVAAARTFLFPLADQDLRMREYYVTRAEHWSNGGPDGSEIFAHDIGAEGADLLAPAMSDLLPGKEGIRNGEYRIWDKRVRAVADGVVLEAVDDNQDNVLVGQGFPPNNADLKLATNFVRMRHGGEVVTYKHLRQGTIPKGVKRLAGTGTTIAAGTVIGRVGNSGHTTNPHLHIECADEATGALRPMAFSAGWIVDRAVFPPPNGDSPWVQLKGRGVPRTYVAIWPGTAKPKPVF